MNTKPLDSFVENHLDLQVRISYEDHHNFLLRHKLRECSNVLDIGTGNGAFVAKLAQDHQDIQFVGIDKRKPCVESCQKYLSANFNAFHVDMFARENQFEFESFDGFLMRYFLLHVDHAQKILELLKRRSKKPAKFWIIDLDSSQLRCGPENEIFQKLAQLVKDFCAKASVDSMGGQNVLPMLEDLGYQNIAVENVPFTAGSIALEDFALYLKQEIQCYSMMLGRTANDPETEEIVSFIDADVRSGKCEVSYGMVLISAELNR